MLEGTTQARSKLTQFHTNEFPYKFVQFSLMILAGLGSHLESFHFQRFFETILTPLQASTVLFKADQRREAQMPPLLPITKEQISNGELNDLLEESDYDLTTMVNLYFILATSSMQCI